ncbi:hypothetical protein EVA_13581 [gut metagenome]|uniref:Uncharacterized protein n=1 Tax=gut metagenome TaxID=749906 RepID=J9CE91_9ZZZZ
MFWKHGVCDTAHFHSDLVAFQELDNGEMLLVAGIYGIGCQFYHRFTTAYYGHTCVDYFHNNVAANWAFEKLSCHSVGFF